MFSKTQTHILRPWIILFISFLFLHIPSTYLIANETDSIFVKKYNKYLHFNSDSIFNKYAEKGYINTTNEIYYYYYEILPSLSSQQKEQELGKLYRIAGEKKSNKLLLEGEFMYAVNMYQNDSASFQKKEETINSVLKNAEERKDTVMKLRAMEILFDLYWDSAEYAKAFGQAYKLDKELRHVTTKKYPRKNYAYCSIGEAYYFFQDYDKAIPFLLQAIEPSTYYFDTSNLEARNILGSYYLETGKVDSAEYYFRTALYSTENVADRNVFDALSLSNLGISLGKKGEYKNAISYLEPGLSGLLHAHNYKLASNVALNLADSYFHINNLQKTKQYLDSAQVYIRRSNHTDLYPSLYTLMSKYYSRRQNTRLANIYFDSTLIANKAYEKKYSGLNILRAEQEQNESEKKAKDEIIRQNEINYRTKLLYSFAIIGVITLFLLIVLFLLRRNKKAYRALVLKNQEWANVRPTVMIEEDITEEEPEKPVTEAKEETPHKETVKEKTEEQSLEPSEEDRELAKMAQDYLLYNKAFKNLDLTLDAMAKDMNVNRNYLSKAINRMTGKNFNTYVNEYRVKEAIKMMSDPKMNLLSIDAIALEVGFGNRISFYQAFKKITGLSPSHFRDNKG